MPHLDESIDSGLEACEKRGWRAQPWLVGLLVGALLAALVNDSSFAAEPAPGTAAPVVQARA